MMFKAKWLKSTTLFIQSYWDLQDRGLFMLFIMRVTWMILFQPTDHMWLSSSLHISIHPRSVLFEAHRYEHHSYISLSSHSSICTDQTRCTSVYSSRTRITNHTTHHPLPLHSKGFVKANARLTVQTDRCPPPLRLSSPSRWSPPPRSVTICSNVWTLKGWARDRPS